MSEDRLHQGPIFVKKSLIHGYGVFAAEDIKEGQVIEECHLIFISSITPDIFNYSFKHKKAEGVIALGYGNIYNHSTKPNIRHFLGLNTDLLVFETLRAIRQGEELFTSYGESWFSQRQLKLRSLPWWHQTYHHLKGLPLRAILVCCGCLAFIQGIKYLSS